MNHAIPQHDSSKGALLKTYKVGLRCPESLLSPFRDLMRRQQLLRFLLRVHSGKFSRTQLMAFEQQLALNYHDPRTLAFEHFKRFNALQQANTHVIRRYKSLFDAYFNFSDAQLTTELKRVNELIAKLNTPNEALNSGAFSRAAVPTFMDPANPLPTEISLHDYEATANKSLKLLCAHLNNFAVKHIELLPETREELLQGALTTTQISKSLLKAHPYKAASAYLGSGRNIDQIAMEQMTGMMEAYRNTRNKVNYVKHLLFPERNDAPDFSEVAPVLMLYYSLPKYFLGYVSHAWKVDLSWVRDTLVGWRRKIDPHLPIKFQVEPLTALMNDLAGHCKAQVSGEEELRVISRLQKKHVLHLLPDPAVDLAPLLPQGLWGAYQQLKGRLKGWTPRLQQEIARHCTAISKELFVRAGEQLYQSVEKRMHSLNPESIGYTNSHTFLKKLKLLLATAEHFRAVFQKYLPGNKFSSAVAKLFTHLQTMQKHKIRRVFTALRGVVALTFARSYNVSSGATGQFKGVFTPDVCVIRPYKSKKRTKSHLPVNLLFNKYVIERQAYPGKTKVTKKGKEVKAYLTNQEATELLKQGEPIWLGLPIYSADQLQEGVLRGRKKATFWFRLFATPKIRDCLKRGAQVKSIRLNVPRGPTNKIVADVTLTATDPLAFAHSGAFIEAWDQLFGAMAFPSGDYLGADFNRIGTYIIAVATCQQEIDLTRPPNMMKVFQEAYDRLETIRRVEIPNLMRKLDSGSGSPQKRGRWKGQLSLLHQRRDRVMTEMKRLALMVYLYLIYRTGARYAAWDGIQGIATRGKKGTLATSISYLPKDKKLYDSFLEWARDLKAQGILPKYKETRIVSPYTSQYCSECYTQGRGLRKTRVKTLAYDEYNCSDPVCGYAGNRHSNSARISALLLKEQIETVPFPLSTG